MQAVRSPLARTLSWLAGPTGRFATAHINAKPAADLSDRGRARRRLACVLWMWMVAQSFEHTIVSSLTQAIRADLTVSSSHTESGFLEAAVDDQLLEELKAVPGVLAVIGTRTQTGIRWGPDRNPSR